MHCAPTDNGSSQSQAWTDPSFTSERRDSEVTVGSSSTVVATSQPLQDKASEMEMIARDGGGEKPGREEDGSFDPDRLVGEDTTPPAIGDTASIHSLRTTRMGGVSTFKACASLVCVVGGTGTLGIPHAIAQGGWIAIGVLTLSLVMSAYTSCILIDCLYLRTNTRRSTYQEIARDALGAFGHWITLIAVASHIFGCAVIYIILSATLLEEMLDTLASVHKPIYVYIAVCTTFVWLCLISTKSMKEVALLSILGTCATLGVVLITVGVSIHEITAHVSQTPIVHKFVDWSRLPIAFATMSFAYGGNVVYPHVEQSMAHPRQWNRVVWTALSFCFVMYLAIGISGYLAFGTETVNPILENLPQGAWTTMANSLITLHVLLAAPIMLTSMSMMVESFISTRSPRFQQGSTVEQFLKRAVPRTIIMFFAGLIASIVPYFGDMMDLLGALTVCLLVFILPVLFYYRLGGLKAAGWVHRIWAGFIALVGFGAMCMGTIDALRHLAGDLKRRG